MMLTLTQDLIETVVFEENGLKSAVSALQRLVNPKASVSTVDLTDNNIEQFKSLYRSYEKKVRSTLLRLTGRDSYEDLTQETFFRVWKGLPKLRSTDSLSTWIYKITLNVAYDEIKKTIRERQNISELAQSPSLSYEPSRQFEYRTVIEKALLSLSIDHRAVLVMHDLEGVTEKEISDILDVPLGTIKSRLFYARDYVRTFLTKEGISHYEQQ